MAVLPVRVVKDGGVTGFEHKYGWFKRMCSHCLGTTRERVRHRFTLSSDGTGGERWVTESAHFSCHVDHCFYSFCKNWNKETFDHLELDVFSPASRETI